MDSGEPLRGVPALGLDPAVGSALVENQPASQRKIHGQPIAPSRLLRPFYWVYEHWLLRQLQQRPMPRHVGLILDGNRRHARRRGVGDPREIYQFGANSSTMPSTGVPNLVSPQLHCGSSQRKTLNDRQLRCRESSQQSRPKSRR